MTAPHIADTIAATLRADGWQERVGEFSKRIAGQAMPGTICPDGARIVALRIDQGGRWLERIDAWGKVERYCDLREFQGRPRSAIASVMA